jgi:hypothetical protein
MLAKEKTRIDDVEFWDRAIQLNDPTPTAARALLRLQFAAADVERMRALSAKAREETLTKSENAEMDNFERLSCVLDILHSKARRVLKRRPA